MEKLIITVGLPASGKTTWANEYNNINFNKRSGERKNIKNLNLDTQKDVEGLIRHSARNSKRNRIDEFILDGLFLTNENIIKACSLVVEECDFKTIEIHYWIKNIKSCLWNDRYRRNINSQITILNAVLEKPDIEILHKVFGDKDITIVEHDIVKKSDLKMFADKYDIYVNHKYTMTSSPWCLGGSWKSCYGDSGSVSPDAPPASFIEFDELLEKACPSITFLQYKNIYNSCVVIETNEHSDYYGGCTTDAYFECDLNSLYNKLMDYNLIEKEGE